MSLENKDQLKRQFLVTGDFKDYHNWKIAECRETGHSWANLIEPNSFSWFQIKLCDRCLITEAIPIFCNPPEAFILNKHAVTFTTTYWCADCDFDLKSNYCHNCDYSGSVICILDNSVGYCGKHLFNDPFELTESFSKKVECKKCLKIIKKGDCPPKSHIYTLYKNLLTYFEKEKPTFNGEYHGPKPVIIQVTKNGFVEHNPENK